MSSFGDIDAEQIILETYMESEQAAQLAPALKIAVDGITKFLDNFPEISDFYQGLPLQAEIAHIITRPLTTAYALGYETRKKEEQAK